jgi:hypothetical protein
VGVGLEGNVAVGSSIISWKGDGEGVSVVPLGNEQADETNKATNTTKYGQ